MPSLPCRPLPPKLAYFQQRFFLVGAAVLRLFPIGASPDRLRVMVVVGVESEMMTQVGGPRVSRRRRRDRDAARVLLFCEMR